MGPETKNCQNCKNAFIVDQRDFDFYKKMDVPAPTFCPQCRFQRRIMFSNERVLYKRKCDLCAKDMVSVFSPDKKLVVYCPACWYSDKWDDGAFYLDYDPNRNIFDQMKELQAKTPHMGMIQDYSTLINSEYVNHAGSLKNCYLIFNADFNENVHYSTVVIRVKDSMDCMMVGESELCYQDIEADGFKIFFSEGCEECREVYFSKDCTGCSNCFGCKNLRNKQYHIFNQPYSKEEYVQKLKEFHLDTYSGVQEAQKQAREFWLKHPYKYMHSDPKNLNSTGDYVFSAKNALNCYQTRQIEDARYCQFITMAPAKDIYDLTEWGNGVEMVVDTRTAGEGSSRVKFCDGAWKIGTLEVEYGMYNVSCKYAFGCINVKKKKYCILNKEYSPEEYQKLRADIVKKMNEHPYVDSKGRVWKYGDFLPYDLSPFDYNETQAQQYFPLTKEQILENGWRWHEPTPSPHKVTLPAAQIPDSIHDITDDILKEVLGCGGCGKAFRLIPSELQLLRRWEFPLPRKCPDCRHMDRLARLNPPKLWDRNCMKCDAPFQTAYAPDRPEIIYCESCYQREVV